MIRKPVIPCIALVAAAVLALLPACSSGDRLTESLYLTELDSERITLGGAPLLIPAYAELYISTSVVTDLPVADTFYLISGTTTSQEMKGFSSNGLGRLTYTDITPDRKALVTAAISFGASKVGLYTFQMYRTGTGDLASKASDIITTVDVVDNIAMVSLITLQPNDYMEIYASSNATNAKIVFLTMSFTVTTVD